MTKKTQANDSLTWGIILIIFGALFLIQKLFHIEIFEHIWQFWPVALIAWGVVLIVKHGKK